MATRFKSMSRDGDEERAGADPGPPAAQDFGYFDQVVSSLSSTSVDLPPQAAPDKTQAYAALERICASSAFHGSRRSQQFLRFIVEQALHGHTNELKERAIAMEVFGRGTDFEPGEDSLVRVKAHELRKRLESFYETDSELECRIEIPLGGYKPRFIAISRAIPAAPELPAPAPAAEIPQPVPPTRLWSRRKLLWTAASLVSGVALGSGAIWQKLHSSANNLDELWKPVFQTGIPLVVFIPVLKDRTTQEITDRVGIGPAEALRRVSDFLDEHQYPYHLRIGSEMNFALLKEQPSLLLGGFSSTWTALMTKGLRYTMQWDAEKQKRSIVDTATGKSWLSVNPTFQGYADADYGLLTRLFDHATGQISMIAGGLTTFGTEAVVEVLANVADFDLVLKAAPANWQRMNFQVVVQAAIVGTTPSHPSIVAVHFW